MGATWFKFFPREYLTDSKVKMLTRTHRSILLDLWCYCTMDGGIPADDESIARLIDEPLSVTRKAMERIRCFFVEQDGLLVSKRMKEETEAYEAKCQKLRDNGTKGGRPRKPNGLANENQMGPEAETEAEAEKDKRLPQPSSTVVDPPADAGQVKAPRKPIWSKSHPDEIVNTTREIVSQWPTPESGAFQPDRKTPVPGVSPSEVATRLAEIQKQGGSLLICSRIAERAVREWKTQGKWIKAPQHFFGPAKDAPWKAYYQAEVTNQRLLGEAS